MHAYNVPTGMSNPTILYLLYDITASVSLDLNCFINAMMTMMMILMCFIERNVKIACFTIHKVGQNIGQNVRVM